jgi:hypothetical protein
LLRVVVADDLVAVCFLVFGGGCSGDFFGTVVFTATSFSLFGFWWWNESVEEKNR